MQKDPFSLYFVYPYNNYYKNMIDDIVIDLTSPVKKSKREINRDEDSKNTKPKKICIGISPSKFDEQRSKFLKTRMINSLDRSISLLEISEVGRKFKVNSKDKVYNITIAMVPKCTCKDFEDGNGICKRFGLVCKHIYFVLMNVRN